MKFLQTPPIPKRKVCLCALSQGQTYITRALAERGCDVLEIPPHPALPEPVRAHGDLLLHDLGDGRVVVSEDCQELSARLRAYGFSVLSHQTALTGLYPGDIALNCLALDGVLYCKMSHTAELLLMQYRLLGLVVEPVRQGYARCSCCVVDKTALITADPSIGSAAARHGIEVLLIRPGHILLPGYPYGFVGGCCGLLEPNVLAFTGNIHLHPDGERILAFCASRGVRVDCLTQAPLLDVGGLIPLLVD